MNDKIGRGLLEPVICPWIHEEMRVEASLTSKQRIDLDKIRRCGFEHIYYYDEWRVWTGNNYIKSWYDVKLPDGTVLTHMWPNAGTLSGKGQRFTVGDGVLVRLSQDSPYRG